MRIIIDASGTVLMYSEMAQPSPDVGQTAIDLSPDLEATFLKAIATAANGLTFDGQTFHAYSASAAAYPPAGNAASNALRVAPARLARSGQRLRRDADAEHAGLLAICPNHPDQ
jgi:hypothetical protein